MKDDLNWELSKRSWADDETEGSVGGDQSPGIGMDGRLQQQQQLQQEREREREREVKREELVDDGTGGW